MQVMAHKVSLNNDAANAKWGREEQTKAYLISSVALEF